MRWADLDLLGHVNNVVFARYLETADANGLDADCLKRLRPSPPFAGDYGWEP